MSEGVDLLAPQELEIMKVIWARGPSTVRDVYEDLLRRRRIAYTSVMTMMNVLERKGHLTKEMKEKAYLYTPAHAQRRVLSTMVGDFVDRVFNGSAAPLLQHLLEEERLTEDEVKQIQRLLRQRKGTREGAK